MSLIVVDAGEEAFLDLILAANYTLRLFRNDATTGLTPPQVDALTAAAFTEANFAGYTSKALTGGSWVTTQANPSTGVYAQQTFTRSSTGTAQLVYGYYVTLTSGGALRWFEQFPAPVSVEFNGDAIRVTPRITLDDEEGNGLEVGDIIPTARATAAPGRLLCQGQAVSRSTFAALFAAIGTAYGVGNGSTTFNVPNLQQRFPLGKATSGTGATLGGTGGNVDHVHPLDSATSHARVNDGAGSSNNHWIQRKTVTSWNSTHEGDIAGVGGAVVANTLGTALGGSSDTGNPPFQVVNFEIVAS
ncbi:MAG TPA: phage tail protein [Acidimicrobiales bacterium]|nr:phage tail protein [Acidimicrobiales bacterium]